MATAARTREQLHADLLFLRRVARDYGEMADLAASVGDGGKSSSCHQSRRTYERDAAAVEAELARLEAGAPADGASPGPAASRSEAGLAEPMTETRLAELEAAASEQQRKVDDAVRHEDRAHSVIGTKLGRAGRQELAEAEKALFVGRAQLEQQKREASDRATAELVAANRAMAEAAERSAVASEASAKASAAAASWARWAAIFTAVAALVAAVQVYLQTGSRP